jgi:2-polyprenyl-3-methyl-5-hydroxy-6-metoxy-1,4-benzoquinol methylase
VPDAVKPAGYYGNSRSDLIASLPRPLGRVLDVGCGEGGTADPLRRAGADAIVGIEMHPPAAALARLVFDHVVEGAVEHVLDDVEGPFDTILLYDVLEHLVDPLRVLEALRGVAAPGARLHVSVPNARHFSLVRDIVVRGTFGYTQWGHRDETHLRWFTRRDLETAFRMTGWMPVLSSHPALSRRVHRLTGGRLAEFTFGQWVSLAYRDELPASS